MHTLREFKSADTEAINSLALCAFGQFRDAFSDWEALSRRIDNMASLAGTGELIVADRQGCVVGAVAYIGPHRHKSEFFSAEWSVLRMLVVEPAHQGQGIGRSLTLECIRRAQRDKAAAIALYTSAIMEVALPMYLRMGFEFEREIPPIFGVPYGIYLKRLKDGQDA